MNKSKFERLYKLFLDEQKKKTKSKHRIQRG